MTIHPWLGGIFLAGGSHPTFVRGEYNEEDTSAGKKLKMAEAGSSNTNPSKEGHILLK
ncbi:UNVERIFIED_CONTAM: hypothetical protein Sradi_1303600 [Sesamum radiatum]|uniref:Uncharacterized protein n=1 Tax=Sesamum radiatum TaxID=300843 RepID=A0AAW2UU69_SESRA